MQYIRNCYDSLFPASFPKFDLNEPSPYDLTNLGGRITHFYTILDPRTLLTTNEQLQESIDLLSAFKNKKINLMDEHGNESLDMNKKLWESKLMTQSVLHPDTGKPIFWAFRFSAFPVLNIPITTLLIYPGSTAIQVFSQFINQSYNVAVNYSNRNGTNPISNEKLAASYVAAVSVSCGIGFGLKQFTKNYNLKASAFLRGFIPYTALTMASCLNLYFIRWNEVTQGISLRIKKPVDNGNDDEWVWKEVGHSKRAGNIALGKCCIARMVWSIPPMFFPGYIMKMFYNRSWFMKMVPWKRMCLESTVIGAVLFTFIPPSLAIYPQTDCVTNKWLEQSYKDNYDQNTKFYFNKGL